MKSRGFWLAAVCTLLVEAPVSPQAPRTFPREVTFEGTLSIDDYERLVELPFEVPAGARRIEVRLSYTGRDRRTAMDLGLRGPSGFRGWSGGRLETIQVSAVTATPGYLPGPIEAGTWALIVGVPNIRRGSQDRYRIDVVLHDSELPEPALVLRRGEGWYVGDLHAHSAHSDGRVAVGTDRPLGAPPHLVFEQARAAGLDFVTLSDHNTVAHWLDVDRLQPYYAPLLLLHGREVTTYRRHANTAGERGFNEFRLAGPLASPASLLQRIAAAGAFVSINHPRRPDDETCMGCGWNVADNETLSAVHGVEVVNGATRTGPQAGWPLWAAWLNRGARLTAVGGSDEHTPDESLDNRIGVPTTVVWARELSEPAIVEGLRSGRVYIRTRGPDGPTIEFDASADGRHYPMGATVPARHVLAVTLRASVGRAAGQTLEWVRRGEVLATDSIEGIPLERTFNLGPDDWVSVLVRDHGDPTLISNAIYVR